MGAERIPRFYHAHRPEDSRNPRSAGFRNMNKNAFGKTKRHQAPDPFGLRANLLSKRPVPLQAPQLMIRPVGHLREPNPSQTLHLRWRRRSMSAADQFPARVTQGQLEDFLDLVEPRQGVLAGVEGSL